MLLHTFHRTFVALACTLLLSLAWPTSAKASPPQTVSETQSSSASTTTSVSTTTSETQTDVAAATPPQAPVWTLANRRRAPGVATALSVTGGLFGFQGVGQLYNGQPGRAVAFFGLGLVSALTMATGYGLLSPGVALVGAGGYTATWVGAAVQANRMAHRINDTNSYGARAELHVSLALIDPLAPVFADQPNSWVAPNAALTQVNRTRVPGLVLLGTF